MILLTVGTQLPFDRLVAAVDTWANGQGIDVVAQVGPASYKPVNFATRDFIAPTELTSLVKAADVIVSHAGMGSILTALTNAKPIVIVPRSAALGEHRNDHQFATTRKFAGRSDVFPAWDSGDVGVAIESALRLRDLTPLAGTAPPSMLEKLSAIIDS